MIVMGCDIHVHTEIKLNETWHTYGSPYVRRCYSLFAKMAGERNNGDVILISGPKGLPEDISEVAGFCYKLHEADWHSASWLNAEEIRQLSMWVNSNYPYKTELEKIHGFEGIFGYLESNAWSCEELPPGIEDIRFVFWFDN